jgi:hypothetical protein
VIVSLASAISNFLLVVLIPDLACMFTFTFILKKCYHISIFSINMFVILRKPVDHFLKAVDEVTVKDIASVAQKLFTSPLTMASYGDGIFPCSVRTLLSI